MGLLLVTGSPPGAIGGGLPLGEEISCDGSQLACLPWDGSQLACRPVGLPSLAWASLAGANLGLGWVGLALAYFDLILLGFGLVSVDFGWI